MPQLIFKVRDCATIVGRGVLVMGDWQFGENKPDQTTAREGDPIELRMPSGRVVASRIEGFDYPKHDILLPAEVIASEIERDTEIYSLNAQ